MEPGVTYAKLEKGGTERFFSLREALGITSFGMNLILLKPGNRGRIHKHASQEEVYLVLSGTLQFKLDDEVIDVPARTAVRVAPEVVRSVWNEGPEDAEIVIASIKIDDPRADGVIVADFWPA